MEKGTSSYNALITKLDKFIRKFYINKLIRGSLYTIGLLIALFLIFNVLEYYFYFDTGVRKVMFGSFVVTSIVALGYWVVMPLIKYLGLGKTISHEQAAHIIGDHFGDVKDRLLNVLQLKKQADLTPDAALLTAGIEQKTESIKLVPFKSAIDLRNNRKYLKYAGPPVLALLVLLFAAPSIIKDGTYRLINNDKEFEPDAPFAFSFADKAPTVVQYDDYTMEVNVDGDVLPAEAYVEVDNFQYRLNKKDQNTFTYTFRNVQKTKPFRVYSGRVSSDDQTLSVLAKPNLSAFNIKLDYPAYTGRKDETIENIGDIVAPEGTRARWIFNTVNTDGVEMTFANNSKTIEAKRSGKDDYVVNKRLLQNDYYKVFITNENVPKGDSVSYALNVTKDEYPVISVEEIRDSLDKTLIYFLGQASDDYGLSDVTFHYSITNEKGINSAPQTIKVNTSSGREVQYSYTFDLETLELKPGDNVQYYFQVGDNDGVNGSKTAKTGVRLFEKPTIEEFKEEEDLNEEEIKEELKEASENLKELQKKFKKLREKLLEEKEINWKDKKEIEKLLEEQKKINEKLEKAKNKFEENLEKQKEFQKPEEQIQEKQEKMQELFEEATDPQKEELMEKIQDMMEELNKEKAVQEMEKMEQQSESQEKEMERLEELFKQLELEKEAEELMDELNELAEEQEKLAEETKKEEKPMEELKKEQEELDKKMEEIEKEMQELEKKNEELSPPKDLGDENQEQMDDIQEDMEQSQEQMDKQDSDGASKSQKSAAEKMKKMASGLQSSMQGGEQEQQEEDIKVIRQLLENLIGMSFEQEDLVDEFALVNTVTPRYADLIQDQYKINDDFKLVEDSLTALANRNDKIQTYVLDKVVDIKSNLKKGLKLLEDRKVGVAGEKQRTSMTNINDLALMLEESMEQMQQSMSSGMPGSQMCQKPGGKGQGKSGKIPSDKLTEGSEGVGEKMKGMMGKKQSGGKNSAKDFAEAAARQAALRKALQDMRNESKERGEDTSELDALIEGMNKIEIDLVNKRLDSEMLKRQQDITTRLLEAEKAARQREYDNKRKAEVGTDKKRELPPSLQEYLKKREAEIEMYKSVSPSLRPYYKSLVDQYYKALKSGK